MRTLILTVVLLCTSLFAGTQWPSGTFSRGVVVGVLAFENDYVRFVINGTKGDGTPGGENFWITLTKNGANAQLSTVMTAFATGATIQIWHYGTDFSYGGQSGYTQGFVYITK